MRWLSIILFVAACAADDSDSQTGAGSFDQELPSFVATLCEVDASCFGADENTCRQDVETDMADAKAALDAAGEQRCAECMDVKTREAQKILNAGCDVNAADNAAVLAACDLNPSDGVQKDDEACAGFP